MHIAIHHDALIPPGKYGGTERVVFWLAQALLELGHQVTLVAKSGSHVPGANLLVATPDWESRLPASVDVLHLFGTPEPAPKRPFLVTIQGNGQPGELFHPNTVFISKKHAENHGASVYVHNGINISDYPCDVRRDDTLVFLAKASWKVKNLAGAIELARAAHLPLTVMGSRDWPWRLQRKLPAFRDIRYLGMVDDEEKKIHLRKARALLFPVRWHEPFGIAITEALASGCAVFGTPYGSLPDIITPEVGALSNSAQDLLSAILNHKYSPQACRNRVTQGFSHLDMARSYASLYERLLGGATLSDPSNPPRSKTRESAETLLPYSFLRDTLT
jgi:glycosyltransferase involved in cell wall biosynthesis